MAVELALNKSALLRSLFQQVLDVCAGSGEKALDIFSNSTFGLSPPPSLRYLKLISFW